MCSACGYPAALGHWTEAGAATPHDRLRERFRRVQVLQKVLKGSGVTAHDGGMVPGIQVMSLSGAQTIVPDLEALWAEVEGYRGRPFDPLDLE
ncbi:MAG: hypothetical protein ABJ263_05710 [Tateyamaria sp.]|uniref:hypothetical protein n=1 Tax=Tateyamaria sp. TaxID=1929288 RepID=UPI003289DE3B